MTTTRPERTLPSPARRAMYNDNAIKLGAFGANCSSGRFTTTAPERWSGSWDDCLRLAQIMDEGGMDFLLPVGRWKGYGGATDYQGATFETITWATGLLAATQRLTVFATVHVPLFHPLVAAKQMVTADHVGRGRFGLNIICGRNEGEDQMFGVSPDRDGERYRQGQEWIDTVRAAWTQDDFDFRGSFFDFRGVREKPKPYGGTLPLIMNAGFSPDGRAYALRNCDAWFTVAFQPGTEREADLAAAQRVVLDAKAEARTYGNDVDVYTIGVTVCRPTHAEAVDFHRYVTEECADWGAIETMMQLRGFDRLPPAEREVYRRKLANGWAGIPLIGTPDEVAGELARLHEAGFTGVGLSFVNYGDEMPYFISEVVGRLERRGLRVPRKSSAGV